VPYFIESFVDVVCLFKVAANEQGFMAGWELVFRLPTTAAD
jgi:hypothetical protein